MNNLLKIASVLAPNMAAKLIYNRISNPKNRKLRDFEECTLAKAKKEIITFRKFSLQAYSWGAKGQPVALLVHGWEGQAGNFGAIVPLLLEKGYQVIAYDGPSHGKSSQHPTNMFEYGDFIATRIAEHQPKLIISHSFGTVSTQLGLLKSPNFSLDQWIIVTTPFSFKEYVESINKKLGLSKRTMRSLAKRIEKDAALPLEEINMATLSPKMNPINSIVIVHSESDKVLSYKDAVRTAASMKGSELIKLQNIGHYKILWSEELMQILDQKILPIDLPSGSK